MFGLIVVTLVGCDLFKAVDEKVKELTNNTVAQGIFLGVSTDGVDLPDGVAFEPGAQSTGFVFDFESQENLAGVTAVFRSSSNGSVEMTQDASGAFQASDLTYTPGERVDIVAQYEGERSLGIDTPEGADMEVPETHSANTDMRVPVTASADAVLVVVMDQAGNITYDTTPRDVQKLLDFALADAPDTVTIPGSAFPTSGQGYLVGIAPMRRSTDEEIVNLNVLGSTFWAGLLEFYPVFIPPGGR